MEPIAEVELTGCTVQLREGRNVNIHFAIGNDCADLPEQKDMLFVKY